MSSYEQFFVVVKEKVIHDLGDSFNTSIFDYLTLSLSRVRRSPHAGSDHYYRSRASKASRVPAYYNPNSHSIHLNLQVLEAANERLIENIYYHELVHAASNHTRTHKENLKILKSGLKVQVWDESERQITLNRSLNEGVTQYFANTYTAGGPAYKNEVKIIGRLIRKIGLRELKNAYFGPAIDELERKVNATLGDNTFETLSELVDTKEYDRALALVD